MQGADNLAVWVEKGRYRRLVVRAIKKPVTMRELLFNAQLTEKSIRFSDIFTALQQLEKKGIIRQLNEGNSQGKIYFFTDKGDSIARLMGIRIEPLRIEKVEWKKYGFVARSCSRRVVVAELHRFYPVTGVRWSASRIREHLNEHHPINMDNLIRTLNELEKQGILQAVRNGKPNYKGYRLTPAGLRIAEVMAL